MAITLYFPYQARPDIVTRARALSVLLLCLILVSTPPFVVLAEVILWITVFSSSELRARLLAACRQPMIAMAIVFYCIVILGVFYSVGGNDAYKILLGWHRVFLLLLAAVLFQEEQEKQAILKALVVVVMVCAIIACLEAAFLVQIYYDEIGIVMRNYATQALFFSVAALTLALYALEQTAWIVRAIAVICIAFLVLNITCFLIGRSGYVALAICTGSFLLALIHKKQFSKKQSMLLIASVALTAVVIVAFSPYAMLRLKAIESNLATYQTSIESTSIGERIFFWKNTIQMIEERPVFGYGTGSFETVYRQHVAGHKGMAGEVTTDPHNQFMKIAAEHGFLGLAVFLLFLFSCRYQRVPDPYRMLGLTVLLMWCAVSLANSDFSTFNEGHFIFFFLGAMLGEKNNIRKDSCHTV